MRRLMLLLSALGLAACASTQDIERYRRGEAPPRAYVSDGCSVVPDLDFRACCEAHDRAYWQGGACADRAAADRALAACMRERGHPLLAGVYQAGVRVGGYALWPFPWRWGYGWPYGIACTRDAADQTGAGHDFPK